MKFLSINAPQKDALTLKYHKIKSYRIYCHSQSNSVILIPTDFKSFYKNQEQADWRQLFEKTADNITITWLWQVQYNNIHNHSFKDNLSQHNEHYWELEQQVCWDTLQ